MALFLCAALHVSLSPPILPYSSTSPDVFTAYFSVSRRFRPTCPVADSSVFAAFVSCVPSLILLHPPSALSVFRRRAHQRPWRGRRSARECGRHNPRWRPQGASVGVSCPPQSTSKRSWKS